MELVSKYQVALLTLFCWLKYSSSDNSDKQIQAESEILQLHIKKTFSTWKDGDMRHELSMEINEALQYHITNPVTCEYWRAYILLHISKTRETA